MDDDSLSVKFVGKRGQFLFLAFTNDATLGSAHLDTNRHNIFVYECGLFWMDGWGGDGCLLVSMTTGESLCHWKLFQPLIFAHTSISCSLCE